MKVFPFVTVLIVVLSNLSVCQVTFKRPGDDTDLSVAAIQNNNPSTSLGFIERVKRVFTHCLESKIKFIQAIPDSF